MFLWTVQLINTVQMICFDLQQKNRTNLNTGAVIHRNEFTFRQISFWSVKSGIDQGQTIYALPFYIAYSLHFYLAYSKQVKIKDYLRLPKDPK